MQRPARICLIWVFLACFLLGAQQARLGAEEEMDIPEMTQPEYDSAEIQWVWGEVVSVDVKSGRIKISYIDYETDTEKEINILTSQTTTYENVLGLEQIKPKDILSVEYSATGAGNIANHISREEIEDLLEE